MEPHTNGRLQPYTHERGSSRAIIGNNTFYHLNGRVTIVSPLWVPLWAGPRGSGVGWLGGKGRLEWCGVIMHNQTMEGRALTCLRVKPPRAL